MGTPLLEARNLAKAYGNGPPVLKNVNLTLHEGDLLVIEGRSGGGKSTLIKLLAGLDHPTAGEVLVDGEPIHALSDAEMSHVRLHKLGLVFQSYNLLPELTLLENVKLPLQIAGKKGADARAGDLLRLLQIGDLESRRPHEVSGGQAQRAAIARALAMSPRAILADEPTGSLDKKNAENVLQAFRDVNRELGTAMLIVSHDDVILDPVPGGWHLEEGQLRERGVPRARPPA